MDDVLGVTKLTDPRPAYKLPGSMFNNAPRTNIEGYFFVPDFERTVCAHCIATAP